jgi:hypothetical protein
MRARLEELEFQGREEEETASESPAGRPAAGRVPVELAVMVRRRGGKPVGVALAEFILRDSKRTPGKQVKELGTVWYWLVDNTNPPIDPDALPDVAGLQENARQAVSDYYGRIAAAGATT